MNSKNHSLKQSLNKNTLFNRNFNEFRANECKVAVIGGGPAGIMAAISAADCLNSFNLKHSKPKSKVSEVFLIEKNETLGKKLLLTGGGRCNITNNSNLKEHIKLFGKKGSFLKPCLYNFDNNSLLSFFNEKGLDFKVENNGKVYPADDKASSVLNTLKSYLNELNVKLILESSVTEIKQNNGYFDILVKTDKFSTQSGTLSQVNDKNIDKNIRETSVIKSPRVILATGGISYPSTGSTGDGMKFAEDLGHKLTELKPGLVPLKIQNEWIKELSGLKFENIGINFKNSSKKRVSHTGNVLFTHFGLSGPGILDISREISSSKSNAQNTFPIDLYLDLIPEISVEELKNKFNLEFQKSGKTAIKNYLKNILPKNFIIPFLTQLNIDPQIKLNQIPKKEKNKLITNLKDLKINITGLMPLKSAMITCGGVNHKNIDSKTMESKVITGIYFAGEIIEFCGPSGGYNLQMAFSTGHMAGKNAANSTINKLIKNI